jgi:hypothetical protein
MNVTLAKRPSAYAADPAIVAVARGWIANCEWPDLDPEDIDELSAVRVIKGVRRHWAGGISAFLIECADEIQEARSAEKV